MVSEGDLNETVVLQSECSTSDEVGADILQQALQEATEEFEQPNEEYETVENAVAIVHGSQPETVAMDSNQGVDDEQPAVVANNATQSTLVSTSATSTGRTLTFRLASGVTSDAPVGSSRNPIQIIQQGNTYHSTQVLTQEQLQQIAQVLQQQQLVQATQNGGASVLYNPNTNTRIVYRVIYPSELHGEASNSSDASNQASLTTTGKGQQSGRGRGRPRKAWGRRFQEDDEKADGPDMSREEKEEKKKHRPRTRSGRISKPPSYMVKDYKRIHHLDFDAEPYDDSDGGYSDYQLSEGEDEAAEAAMLASLPPGVTTARARNYKCNVCDKAYIGKGGLARHYRLNSTHGNIEDIESDNSNAAILSADDSSNMDSRGEQKSATEEPSPGHLVFGDSKQATNLSASLAAVMNSSTTAVTSTSEPAQDDSLPTSETPPPVTEGDKMTLGNRPRSLLKGRNYSQQDGARRKARLKDLIRQCEDEELMEIVMPRLSQAVSAWEFLLMKCEKGAPAHPNIQDMYVEFETLLKHITRLTQECLVKVSPESNTDGVTYLNIANEQVAEALGLTTGKYEVKAPSSSDGFRYKMLCTDPVDAMRNQTPRRKVQIVAPEELVAPNVNKRRKMDNSNQEHFQVFADNETNETSGSSSSILGSEALSVVPAGEPKDDMISNQTGQDQEMVEVEMVSASDGDTFGVSETVLETSDQCEGKSLEYQETLANGDLGVVAMTNQIVSSENVVSMDCQQLKVDGNIEKEDVENSVCQGDAVESVSVGMQNTSVTPGVGTQTVETSSGNCATKLVKSNNDSASIMMVPTPTQLLPSAMQPILGQVVGTIDGGVADTKIRGGGSVIRHVMIQNGQIIGASVTSTVDDGLTGSGALGSFAGLAETSLLASNVVIVENGRGGMTALQLPADQPIPLETVQALLAMDTEAATEIMSVTEATETTQEVNDR